MFPRIGFLCRFLSRVFDSLTNTERSLLFPRANLERKDLMRYRAEIRRVLFGKICKYKESYYEMMDVSLDFRLLNYLSSLRNHRNRTESDELASAKH
jgi:hypothetical protein